MQRPAASPGSGSRGFTGGMNYTAITPDDVAGLDGFGDWRVITGTLQAEYLVRPFPSAARFVAAIADAAEALDHHPDLHLRFPGHVRAVLSTHAIGGLSTMDVDLARQISVLAAEAGATSNASAPQTVEIGIDTMDPDRIRPFWAAALGYREADGCLVDPAQIGPPLWFQQMSEPRDQRSRFHIDISVPHDVALARVDAAVAAGGRLVSDRFARSWWVLADADGNEACICTWQDRR